MGYFGDHGQLRWDENQGVQYIVAWDVDDIQPNFNGIIEYQINQRKGNITPIVRLAKRADGITFANNAGSDRVKLTIDPNSSPNIEENTTKRKADGSYYVALTKGYLAGTLMPDGDYILADAFVTAIVPPENGTDIVPESVAFDQNFEVEFELQGVDSYDKLDVCFYDTVEDKWKLAESVGAVPTADPVNGSIKVSTTRLGQYVVASTRPPIPVYAPQGAAPQQDILDTIQEAGATVEAAGKAMRASTRAISTLSRNGSPY